MTTTAANISDITQENYTFLQHYVYRTSGIVLDDNKHYLLEARLLPIVRKESLKTINDLCALIRATSGGQISQEVVEAMTTNETLFFRDNLPFKVMRTYSLAAFDGSTQGDEEVVLLVGGFVFRPGSVQLGDDVVRDGPEGLEH